jgi:ubiquinone biosynthesis protein COQ9
LKIRERVALAVRTRLLQHAAHREALRALAAFLALPAHAGLATRCLWRTVDAMWRAIGDTATDFNYYTKRALLAGVYGSTLLVWLDDSSEGFADSFAFLDRRIADVMTIERGKARLGQCLDSLFRRAEAMGPRPRHDYPRPDAPPGPRTPTSADTTPEPLA